MELSVIQNNKNVVVKIIGEINTETSEKLSNTLNSINVFDLDLTLDFEHTTYITSSGLRILTLYVKKLGQANFHLINVNTEIMNVFEMTGFLSILDIKQSDSKHINIDNENFVSLLNYKVENCPNSVAYNFDNKDYTWQDIEVMSQIIARDLDKSGIKKGSRVGVCSLNMINAIGAFFAIQKLGAIAVLIRGKANAKEIAEFCKLTDVTTLCYAENTDIGKYDDVIKDIKTYNDEIVKIYNISSNYDYSTWIFEYGVIKNDFDQMFNPDDLSLIIFTKGQKSQPKPVMLSSYSLFKGTVDFEENDDVYICKSLISSNPISNIFGLFHNLCLPLIYNVKTFITPHTTKEVYKKLVSEYKIECINLSPEKLINLGTNENFDFVRLALIDKNQISETELKTIKSLYKNVNILKSYGMAELPIISVSLLEDSDEKIVNTVGQLFDDVQVEIRNSNNEVLKNGEIGKIFVKSPRLSTCYYKLNPLAQPVDDNGWLDTGDFGSIDDERYLKLSVSN